MILNSATEQTKVFLINACFFYYVHVTYFGQQDVVFKVVYKYIWIDLFHFIRQG